MESDVLRLVEGAFTAETEMVLEDEENAAAVEAEAKIDKAAKRMVLMKSMEDRYGGGYPGIGIGALGAGTAATEMSCNLS